MKKELFTQTRDLLLAISGIDTVKIWNNDILNGADTLGRFPLIFLQFTGLNYATMNGNVQECNGAIIVVHLLYSTIDDQDTGVFDFSQEIFTALQLAGFRRIGESADYTGGEVIDWQITFEAPRFEDEAAKIALQTIIKPSISII